MTSLSLDANEKARKKAGEVNEISLNYHLSHATVACNILLQKDLKEAYESKMEELNDAKKVAIRNNDKKNFDSLVSEQIALLKDKRFQIYVEYLKHPDEYSARTVRIEEQLIIYLSEKILQKSRINNKYTQDVVHLRKLTAHELGHAILHTKELIETRSMNGSFEFNGTNKEIEADIFRDKLLELRHARNTQMRNDKTLEHFF